MGFECWLLILIHKRNASFYLVTEKHWAEWAESRGSLKDIFQTAIIDEPFDVSSVIMEGLFDCIDLLPSHLDLLPVDLGTCGKMGSTIVRSQDDHQGPTRTGNQ